MQFICLHEKLNLILRDQRTGRKNPTEMKYLRMNTFFHISHSIVKTAVKKLVSSHLSGESIMMEGSQFTVVGSNDNT